MQDTIERRITIRAPKERIFKAIIDPTEIVKWFPNAVEGKFVVGESPIIDFDGGIRHRIHIVAIDPHDYFAFRWVPCSLSKGEADLDDVLSRTNTLVEFRLMEDADGTTVSVKESGFAAFPPQAFADNTRGWAYMFERLEKLFAQE